MTAIAYRDGVMAADTAVWHHGTIPYHIKKIDRINGMLVAATGRTGLVLRFKEWVRNGMEGEFDRNDAGEDGFHGIIVLPSEIVLHVEIMGPAAAYKAPFYVLGAAHELMLGAMAVGATAKQAVEAAIQWSNWAGGGVQVERLHENAELAEIIGGPAIAA